MATVTRAPSARPGAPGDRKTWIVSAALFAPLLLLLLVAARTWRAEQRYERVTHQILHDYAGIAAWQYARRANGVLHEEVMRAFGAVATGHQRTGSSSPLEPPATILAARGRQGSLFLDSASFAFTYDAASGRFETAGGTVTDGTKEMLLRRLLEMAKTARSDDEPHHVLFDSGGATDYAVALWTISSPDEPVRGAYGVAADQRVLHETLGKAIPEGDLLPATNASSSLDGSHIAARLTRRNGGVVFATEQPLGSTAATDSTTLQSGELRTTVDLSPALAKSLMVGGAPSSQLPSLALMIVVASLLAVIGLAQERRSRELARLRSRFVANVSHELRTPLAQISMFAETLTLGRERSAEEGRHFASIIFAEARRLTGLVESVLRFSRLESSHQTLRMEPADISREISEAVETFAPVAGAAEVSIELHLADDAYASIDRSAFRQIILNLLDNAVRHGGHGTSVDVSAERQDGDLRITVADSGPGVPPAWRERVFHPFVRVEQGGAGGAGIGLAVVRDLVTAHGGRVWIEQSESGGARFEVAIPAAHSTAHVEATEPVTAEK